MDCRPHSQGNRRNLGCGLEEVSRKDYSGYLSHKLFFQVCYFIHILIFFECLAQNNMVIFNLFSKYKNDIEKINEVSCVLFF